MLTLQELKYITKKNSLYNISITFLSSSITYFNETSKLDNSPLFKIIANIYKPISGRVIVSQKKPYCLYINNNLGLQNQMTPLEHLKFWSRLYNSSETIEASIHCFGLQNVLNVTCDKLSIIDRKKLALSKLISCQSDVWLLDEIESDLNEETKHLVQNLIISKANSGGIILISTQCDKAIKTAHTLNMEDYSF